MFRDWRSLGLHWTGVLKGVEFQAASLSIGLACLLEVEETLGVENSAFFVSVRAREQVD
jgi:hypothetical protein